MERVVRVVPPARLFTGGLLVGGLLVHHCFRHVGQNIAPRSPRPWLRRFLHTRSHDGRGERSSRVVGAGLLSIPG